MSVKRTNPFTTLRVIYRKEKLLVHFSVSEIGSEVLTLDGQGWSVLSEGPSSSPFYKSFPLSSVESRLNNLGLNPLDSILAAREIETAVSEVLRQVKFVLHGAISEKDLKSYLLTCERFSWNKS